jgi:exopolysaccharide biosynthesis polyprenyl glycosylphosphotransferase
MKTMTRTRPRIAEVTPLVVAEERRSLHHLLVAVDVTAVVAAWLPTILLAGFPGWFDPTVRLAAVTAAALTLLRVQRLWLARVCLSRVKEAAGLGRVAIGTAALAYIGAGAGEGGVSPAAWWAAAGGLATFLLLSAGRSSYDAWLRAERARGRFTRPVVVVGQGDEAVRILELLVHHPELGYRIGGLVGDRLTADAFGVHWLGTVETGLGHIPRHGVTGAIVATCGLDADVLNRLVRDLLARRLHVQLSSGLWRLDHRRVRVTPLAHEPFLYVEPGPRPERGLALKRTVDILGAATLLLVSAPITLGASLAIMLSDRGPVFFRQTRVGRDGRPFTLFKFRTMVTDAEARLEQLAADNERHGPLFKLQADPRVTRVGRFLRASSLDELPQLFNVLGGSMSLVGPRPALPSEVARFDPDLRERHRFRPGVTGLWQLEARDNASFYAYRHLDLFYVDNWSFALDLVILAATVPAVAARTLRGAGTRSPIVAVSVPAGPAAGFEPAARFESS